MPALTAQALREQLISFAFKETFLARGWNAATRRPLLLTVREREVACTPIAEQGGWMVLEITAGGEGAEITAPGERAWREMVDKVVTEQMHHHILIFINAARSEAVWQFSATIGGKRLRRERRLQAGTPIAPLLALLRGMEIPFDLLDEEGELSVTSMNDRMAKLALTADKVSKKFYDLIAKKRQGFELFLSWVDGEKDRSWYITALLNRLMFIYFIQQKGLMKGDPAYLRNRLNDCISYKHNFYREFFLPLCFFGFAKPWGERKKFGGHFDGIPYLNGGLFLPHKVELDHGITAEAVEAGTLPTEITIPNEQFVAWFDFFDKYRWTLDEEHLENEEQINPDILGYIFEKYINQKQMGAYYTKEDITGYICRNTIIPRLFDMLAASGKKGTQAVNPLPIGPHPNLLNDGKGISGGAGIEKYIYPAMKTQQYLPTETEREYLARQQRFESILRDFEDGKITAINDIITYNLDIEQLALDFIHGIQDAEVLRDFYFSGLRGITVLDPTCGSGAFLFAALKVLFPLYAACVKKMEEFHAREAGASTVAVTWKGDYAFDFINDVSRQLAFIDTPDDGREAILEQFGAELQSIREHDNVEYFIYKRIIVDNLFGVDIMAEAVEICKLRLFLKLIAHAEPVIGKINLGIEPLPDVDFNILCGNTLVGFATHTQAREAVLGKGQGALQFDDTMERIDAKARAVDSLATAFRQSQTTRNVHSSAEKKAELEQALRGLEHELNGYLARQYGIVSQQIDEYKAWLVSHQPFHWYVEFYGIIARGGFDIVIGNPPYIEYSSIKKEYLIRNYETEGCGNLFAFVMERSKAICDITGRFGMIVPISSISTPRMAPLYNFMISRSSVWISNYAVRPGKLFVGVDMNLSIWLAINSGSCVSVTRYNRWPASNREYLFPLLHYMKLPFLTSDKAPKISNDLELSIITKLNCVHSRIGSGGTSKIFVHSGGRYFRKALLQRLSNEYKPYCVEINCEHASIAALSSSLYYWHWLILSDTYHVTKEDISSFAVPNSILYDDSLNVLGKQLETDLYVNARIIKRARADGSIQDEYNFSVGLSKPIIDEIYRVLARHYGFTDEELDFIINYDIKYRMGRDAEEEVV